MDRLIRLSSSPLVDSFDVYAQADNLPLSDRNKEDLLYLLSRRNGFYAFESALHVFPLGLERSHAQELRRWNDENLWKASYGDQARRLFCFGENIFGEQFAFADSRIGRFDPETGEFEDLCNTLDEWAELILDDYPFHTGYKVGHEWQALHGRLSAGDRLVPIYPFVTPEGTYEIGNFYKVDALKGMLSRAAFAKQIQSLPDGSQIRLSPINVGSDMTE